jgi:hypothetical protein
MGREKMPFESTEAVVYVRPRLKAADPQKKQ